MHIKDVKVTNNKNVLVQVPGFVVNKWALSDKDKLEVHISDDGTSIIVRPKKVRSGSNSNEESQRMA